VSIDDTLGGFVLDASALAALGGGENVYATTWADRAAVRGVGGRDLDPDVAAGAGGDLRASSGLASAGGPAGSPAGHRPGTDDGNPARNVLTEIPR
jgi:hypothetical protein